MSSAVQDPPPLSLKEKTDQWIAERKAQQEHERVQQAQAEFHSSESGRDYFLNQSKKKVNSQPRIGIRYWKFQKGQLVAPYRPNFARAGEYRHSVWTSAHHRAYCSRRRSIGRCEEDWCDCGLYAIEAYKGVYNITATSIPIAALLKPGPSGVLWALLYSAVTLPKPVVTFLFVVMPWNW
jgi:hypothetical protein